jgi:hypothetical protein
MLLQSCQVVPERELKPVRRKSKSADRHSGTAPDRVAAGITCQD